VLPTGTLGEELVLGPVAVSGEEVETANGLFDTQAGQWVVSLNFRRAGSDAWTELTADAACAMPNEAARRVAIVLDDEVISSPGSLSMSSAASESPAVARSSPAASPKTRHGISPD
jgi:preprotein translocase subunit SecD